MSSTSTTSSSTTSGSTTSVGTPVLLATTPADARAVEAVLAHHAELRGRMTVLTAEVVAAATTTAGPHAVDERCEAARQALLAFTRTELLPHARAEEGTMYAAAAEITPAELLVVAMRSEHTLIGELVDDLAARASAVGVAATAQALVTLFGAHVDKENDLLLPLLAATPGVSVADLLGGMHELIGGGADRHVEPGHEHSHEHSDEHGHEHGHEGQAAAGGTTAGAGGCSCGSHDAGIPELDVRTVPHVIRHATVFGAFDAIGPGGSLDLIAPHDPQPLVRQLRERTAGALDVTYLDRGPDAWRLRLTKA